MSKHIKSEYVHIVLSPKDYPDPQPLIDWLTEKSLYHVVSEEHGANGHAHVESFAELKKESRTDHVKRSLRSLYPDIPPEEWKNVRVTVNTIDPNPLYGFGYSLKEGKVISSNLSPETMEESRRYYAEHRSNVEKAKNKIFEKEKSLTLKSYGNGLLDFVTVYYQDRKYAGESVSWICDEYRKTLVKSRELDLNLYQKLNSERISQFVEDFLGAVLLTAPTPTPINFKKSKNNPLI